MSEKSKPKRELETVAATKALGATNDEVVTVGTWLRQVANNPETSNGVRGEAIKLSEALAVPTTNQQQRNELMQRAAGFATRASE